MSHDHQITQELTHAGKKIVVMRHSMPFVGTYYTGYVGIPEDHPFYGKHYDAVMDMTAFAEELTFAGALKDEGSGTWFIGFDFAHPGMKERTEADAVAAAQAIAESLDDPIRSATQQRLQH